jgi:Transposase IS116/IS110/IS902 family
MGWLCPTNKESGGKRIQGPMNRGNVWLRAIMGEVAWASVKTKASYQPVWRWREGMPGRVEEMHCWAANGVRPPCPGGLTC